MADIPLQGLNNHESRHSYRHAENEQRPTEHTPLLRPPGGGGGGGGDGREGGGGGATSPQEPRDYVAAMVVTMLLILFISGVIIGIYLLVVQSNSENVLPPVQPPLQFVSRSQWNSKGMKPLLSLPTFRTREVVVLQTDTRPCYSVPTCTELLKNLQANDTQQRLPYNFLLSSNGQAYEALGWHQPSPMFPQHPLSLVLAFIGNFTETSPTPAQLNEARNFFDASVSLRYLKPSYYIIGKNTKCIPKYLFKSMSTFTHWNSELSDS